MRIAVSSDIHGNIAALEAVLVDPATRSVDQIVNLGDICAGALFPAETADRLIPLRLPTIRGNHERQLLNLTDGLGPSDRHAAEMLRPENGVFPGNSGPGRAPRGNAREVAARAGGVDARVILFGHTHIQRVVALDDGRLIGNPGRVGLPAYADNRPHLHVVESGSPDARYVIVATAGAEWTVDSVVVDYDWDGAASDAEANGCADWGGPLRTGLAR